MALLRIVGADDELARAAVEAALLGRDPAAAIRPDWTRGLLRVESVVTDAELCAAVIEAGYIAAPLSRSSPRASSADILRLIGRMVLFAIAAGIGGMIVGTMAGVANLSLDASCRTSTDEGACAMGIPLFAVGFATVGAAAAAGITMIRGAVRLFRRAPTG